jgi:hypothetical protein
MKTVRVASWIWLACALAACSSSHEKLDLGGTCSLNSDCNEPLLCKFGYCHKACVRSVDCDNGGRCVTVDGVAVCQTQAESSCGANQTCSTGLVCRTVDNTCRTSCSPTNDTCMADQTCNGTVCLENKEVANPGTDAAAGAGDAATSPDAGSTGPDVPAAQPDAAADAPADSRVAADTSGGSTGGTTSLTGARRARAATLARGALPAAEARWPSAACLLMVTRFLTPSTRPRRRT